MSKENNLTDFLTDVADAIREKKGTSEKINPQDFSEEIRSIGKAPEEEEEEGEPEYVESFTIVDGASDEFVNSNTKTVGTLTYKRTFSAGALNNIQPLYLPFEVPVSELLEKYDVAYINDFRETFDANGNIVEGKEVIEFVLIKSGTLKANHPYVIRPKSEEALNWELVLNDAKLHSTNGKNYSVECSSATKVSTFKGIYKKTTRAELAGDEVTPVYVMSKSGSMGTLKNPTSTLGAFRFYMMKSNKDGSPYIE